MSARLEERDRLFTSARAIFVSEGVAGLSLRRVAESAGCTTMVVYSRFGGKDGLIAALYDEGFNRLATAQASVDQKLTGADRVMALCLAYLQCARQYPQHYSLMLGQSSASHQPSDASLKKAAATLNTLSDALLRTISVGPKRQLRATTHAKRLFAFCHGWASLEQQGFLTSRPADDASFRLAVSQLLGD